MNNNDFKLKKGNLIENRQIYNQQNQKKTFSSGKSKLQRKILGFIYFLQYSCFTGFKNQMGKFFMNESIIGAIFWKLQ